MFAAAHASLMQSSVALIMGILIGIVYERTKSIGTVMLIHSVFNFSVCFTPIDKMSNIVVIIMSVAGLLLTLLSMLYLSFGTNPSLKG